MSESNLKLVTFASVMMILIIGCSGQSPKKIYNKDFNWTITIPDGFENVKPEDWEKLQDKGANAIENTYGQEVENRTKTIFVFRSEQLNYFESNYQPFDENVDGDYLESLKGVNEVLYETFISQLPGVTVDTTRAVETIDNLQFHVSKMKITYPNKMVMNFLMYSRVFDKKEFTVNIMYVDDNKGKKMKEAWLESKFSK